MQGVTRGGRRSGLRGLGLLAAILAVVLGLTVLSGCGDGEDSAGSGTTPAAAGALDGLTADQILEKTRAAAAAATSVRMVGAVKDDTQGLIELDLKLKAGEGAIGTMGIGGGDVEIVVVGKEVFIKGNEAFYRAVIGEEDWDPNVANLLVGRYIKAGADNENFGPIAAFTDMQAFLAEVLKPETDIERVDSEPVGGVPTVGLKGGKEGEEAVLQVLDQAEPYPARLAPIDNPDNEGFTFSEWNAPVELAAPPADQVVDVSSFLK
jgi:hypothetical protein